MQDKHIFEYAVIRFVPRIEREEFLNLGVILYCSKHRFLGVKALLDEARVRSFAPGADIDTLKSNLLAFEQIARGENTNSPIARLDHASRFRWLTATRSTIIQSSKVHPGLCADPQKQLDRLFEELVG